MPIPKLYTVLPLKDGNPDTTSLTDHSSEKVIGTDDETYVALSYFPEKLKYSAKSKRVFNKYVLFILNGSESKEYQSNWEFEVFNGDIDITHEFNGSAKINLDGYEYLLGIEHSSVPETNDWDYKLKITCHITKDGEDEKVVELEHNLLPIESDLLSENGASFEDESGTDNSSVLLGNEGTTHFVSGHLGEYLVKLKQNLNSSKKSGPGKASNDASVFVNDSTAIIYNNVLSVVPSVGTDLEGKESNFFLQRYFDLALNNTSIENSINKSSEYPKQNEYKNIGLCSLNLHHVHSYLYEKENARIAKAKKGEDDKICLKLKSAFDASKDNFTLAYLRSIFPKSAISLSVSILDTLFQAFQKQASSSNRIYETYQSSESEKNAKIETWKKLNYSELPDSDSDAFMKNLLSEYHHGYYALLNRSLISAAQPRRILKIDWSQFIQKILNPSTVTVPFTLIKIQVLDLRSGKPIKNALVNRTEFQTFQSEPNYLKDNLFSYVMVKAHDSKLTIKPTDSRNRRVQKICSIMGYHTDTIDDGFGEKMAKSIYKYMTSSDRVLSEPVDAPASGDLNEVKKKKDAWIDYIIEDFTSNCITDDDGMLNCRIPDELLENSKVNINVGFSEFAVVREIFEGEDETIMKNPPIKRPYAFGGSGPTDFMAHWVGDPGGESSMNPNEQNLSWENNIMNDKNFGWKITEHTGLIEGTETESVNQLKIGLTLEVKKSSSKDYSYLKLLYPGIHELGYSTEHFSTFFEDSDIHFTLFGMQWCQPVWDEYDPNELNEHGNPKNVYIQNPDVTHPHMNLVTLGLELSKGKFKYSGKGYGKFEIRQNEKSVWRGGNGHKGYDVHAPIGANVFAYHYGKVKASYASVKGHAIEIRWKSKDPSIEEFTRIWYLHLNPPPHTVSDGANVMAGTAVAKGGRTGNIDSEDTKEDCSKVCKYPTCSWNPSHVHISVDFLSSTEQNNALRKTMDTHYPENARVLPSNHSPIIFPCRGEVTSPKYDPKACKMDHKFMVDTCWAAAELRCPHINPKMNSTNENSFQLQAQLRFLNEQPETVQTKEVDKWYKIKSHRSDEHSDHLADVTAFMEPNKNENYFHPSTVDGKPGNEIAAIESSDIAIGTQFTSVSTPSGLNNKNHTLKQVRYKDAEGTLHTTWVEKALIDGSNKSIKRLQNLPSKKPSKTQMAIYCFRKQHELIKTDNYYQNFNTNDEFWEELNAQCGF